MICDEKILKIKYSENKSFISSANRIWRHKREEWYNITNRASFLVANVQDIIKSHLNLFCGFLNPCVASGNENAERSTHVYTIGWKINYETYSPHTRIPSLSPAWASLLFRSWDSRRQPGCHWRRCQTSCASRYSSSLPPPQSLQQYLLVIRQCMLIGTTHNKTHGTSKRSSTAKKNVEKIGRQISKTRT